MKALLPITFPAAILGAGALVSVACGGGAEPSSTPSSGTESTSASGGTGGTTATSSAVGSTVGATTGVGGVGGVGGESGVPPGMVPGLIAVGYGGIRIVSRDQGLTWGDRASETVEGGDDEHLLRAVVYGNGLWIATGWKYWTSPDGIHWDDHGLLGKGILPCSIVEGLAFLGGAFWAACGTDVGGTSMGAVFRSPNGLIWSDTPFGIIGDTSGHLSLTARGGKMVAYGDNGVSFESSDGAAWSVMPGLEAATYCNDQWKSMGDCDPTTVANGYHEGVSFFDGVWLKSAWQGEIIRATDGVAYTTVFTDDQKNTVYTGRTFANGYVAAKN